MKTPILLIVLTILISLPLGALLHNLYTNYSTGEVISPFISQDNQKSLPLQQYSIPNLSKRTYTASPEITLKEIITEEKEYTSYLFSYTTMDKKMTGMINIPNASDATNPNKKFPTIVMLRGWVPKESYTSGIGTKNAAAVFAKNGYVTIAPDFFDHGESDSEPKDSWEARFIKPINVIELIKTIADSPDISLQIEEDTDVPTGSKKTDKFIQLNPTKIGMWAHSNGGQIALTTLEVMSQTDILDQAIPTTLWAPVTAPFPYSILFFNDELEDEGKASRKWVSMFEDDYDVFDFTMTKHLDKLTGPIQIHHGTADEAAIISWSDEFVDKVEVENDEVDITYHRYPGANHNMQPGWDVVVGRDLEFFEKKL